MSELAQPASDIVEGEPPEVLARNLGAAGHLLAGATAFFFLAFLFSYFYLRSLNNADMWRPKGVDASIAWGTIMMACVVASAILVRYGKIDQHAGRRDAFRLKAVLALGLGIAALVVQAVGWTQQGFGPADGGFASVYFGWTAFLWLFILFTLFWLENIVATSFRYRNMEGTGASGRLGRDIRNPLDLNRGEISALSFYWTFLAGIVVLAWIVLYLV